MSLDMGITFAKLDVIKHEAAKQEFGVHSYPALKIFRDGRHKWLEFEGERDTNAILKTVKRELEGPFKWADSAKTLRTALGQIFDQSTQEMGEIGRGEALTIAYLPEGEGSAAAAAYAKLAAGLGKVLHGELGRQINVMEEKVRRTPLFSSRCERE